MISCKAIDYRIWYQSNWLYEINVKNMLKLCPNQIEIHLQWTVGMKRGNKFFDDVIHFRFNNIQHYGFMPSIVIHWTDNCFFPLYIKLPFRNVILSKWANKSKCEYSNGNVIWANVLQINKNVPNTTFKCLATAFN